jgi:hypothetical protein
VPRQATFATFVVDPEPAVGRRDTPCIEVERSGRRPVANLNAPGAESVARSVCGLVRITTVLSRCDRGADEKWRRQSSKYGLVNAGRVSRESNEMRPLRYSINVTLDGCCHHEAGLPPDEESMRHWTAEMERADALLFGRVTYEMMESAWRKPATGTWPDWMNEWQIPFAETSSASPASAPGVCSLVTAAVIVIAVSPLPELHRYSYSPSPLHRGVAEPRRLGVDRRRIAV